MKKSILLICVFFLFLFLRNSYKQKTKKSYPHESLKNLQNNKNNQVSSGSDSFAQQNPYHKENDLTKQNSPHDSKTQRHEPEFFSPTQKNIPIQDLFSFFFHPNFVSAEKNLSRLQDFKDLFRLKDALAIQLSTRLYHPSVCPVIETVLARDHPELNQELFQILGSFPVLSREFLGRGPWEISMCLDKIPLTLSQKKELLLWFEHKNPNTKKNARTILQKKYHKNLGQNMLEWKQLIEQDVKKNHPISSNGGLP